jgi:hypothetical protein
MVRRAELNIFICCVNGQTIYPVILITAMQRVIIQTNRADGEDDTKRHINNTLHTFRHEQNDMSAPKTM